MKAHISCHICGEDALRLAPGFSELPRVTSDCKPFVAGGELAVCESCNTVQKVVGPVWRDEIAGIYDAYAIYEQGGGEEQAVFDQTTGAALRRSERLLDSFAANVDLGTEGSWLDVGCGNGAMLRAVAEKYGSWKLSGSELSDANRSAVEGIKQVEAFYAGPLSDIGGCFDVISMIHVLEHVENPLPFLANVRRLMGPDSVLLVQLPYWADNPFDLTIADHCTHFTPSSLTRLLESAGFDCTLATSDWVAREISAIAIPAKANGQGGGFAKPEAGIFDLLRSRVEWLQRVDAEIKGLGKEGLFGIFGSSIGAAFAFGAAGAAIDFFVDEDANRIGREHLGKPIISPDEIDADAKVYIPLPPSLSGLIAGRLNPDGNTFMLPPTLADDLSRVGG